MPYIVEPKRLLLRFTDERLYSVLRGKAKQTGMSRNEAAQLLLKFALGELREPEEMRKAKTLLPRRFFQS